MSERVREREVFWLGFGCLVSEFLLFILGVLCEDCRILCSLEFNILCRRLEIALVRFGAKFGGGGGYWSLD